MKNKVNLIFLMSSLCAVLSISLYVYLYISVNNDKTIVNELILKNREDAQKINELERIERNLKSNLAIGNKLSGYFVKTDSIVDFIQKIESIINSNNVSGSVDSVSESKIADALYQNMSDLNLSITAKGDWNGLIKLVGLLENLPYKSTIDNVNFSNIKLETPKAKSSTEKVETPTVSKVWQVNVKMRVKTIKQGEQEKVEKEIKPTVKQTKEDEEN